MAVVNFDDLGEGRGGLRPGQVQRMVNLSGAATSVALVLGLAIWGYKIAVRDINGIPVIHADAGPMRIAPEDPGGQIADNLGLEVNRVAAEDSAVPATDKLTLAPRPVELSDQDIAAADTKVAAARANASAAVPGAGGAKTVRPAVTAGTADAMLGIQADATPVLDDSEDPSGGTDGLTPPSADQEQAAAADPTSAAIAAVAASVASVQGVPKGAILSSVRPMPRPRTLAAPATLIPASSQAVPKVVPAVAKEIDPATLPVGTRLVQLGAYDDLASANAAWTSLKAKFGDLMADKSRVIQKASSGGRDFLRLRAFGFKTEEDARRFCSALAAENAVCVPVLIR